MNNEVYNRIKQMGRIGVTFFALGSFANAQQERPTVKDISEYALQYQNEHDGRCLTARPIDGGIIKYDSDLGSICLIDRTLDGLDDSDVLLITTPRNQLSVSPINSQLRGVHEGKKYRNAKNLTDAEMRAYQNEVKRYLGGLTATRPILLLKKEPEGQK